MLRPLRALGWARALIAASVTAAATVMALMVLDAPRQTLSATTVEGASASAAPTPLDTLPERPVDPEPPPEPEPERERTDGAERAVLAVGQRIMATMGPGGPQGRGSTEPSTELLGTIRAGRVGGIILFQENVQTFPQVQSAIERMQAAAREGGRPPLLIAVDQEGGDVKRFSSAPPTRSPREMGAAGEGVAERQGGDTAAQLSPVGVNVDLAPVADVPSSPANFLGSRAFGGDPAQVAAGACAFARGLEAQGMHATLKHFPGLGLAGANTDEVGVSIAAPAADIRRGYAPYEACARGEAGAGLVMMSNAGYPALDDSNVPAVMSRSIIADELRGRLGFDGIVISDDLETPGIVSRGPSAVSAAAAGTDILLYARSAGAAAEAHDQLMAAVESGELDREGMRASLERIAGLKGAL